MSKLSFDHLHFEVSKMFNQATSDVKDLSFAAQVVEERTERIREFIEACGWEVDDYISRTFQTSVELN